MWILKRTSTAEDGSSKEVLHQCDSYEVTTFPPGTLSFKDMAESNDMTEDEALEAGLVIMLRLFNHTSGIDPQTGEPVLQRNLDRLDIWLPRDGESVHAIDPATGKIVNGYKWPPRGGPSGVPSRGVSQPQR